MSTRHKLHVAYRIGADIVQASFQKRAASAIAGRSLVLLLRFPLAISSLVRRVSYFAISFAITYLQALIYPRNSQIVVDGRAAFMSFWSHMTKLSPKQTTMEIIVPSTLEIMLGFKPLVLPPVMPYVRTNGGRAASHAGERGDCTVRALAVAAGVDYAIAHISLAAAGRRANKGVKLHAAILSGKVYGFKFTRVGTSSRTVAKFIREHPQGRFLCRKRRHAFAIVDGVVHDGEARRPREIITHAWRVQFHA